MATTAVSNVARPCPRLSQLQSHSNANPRVFGTRLYSSHSSSKNINVALCKSHIKPLKTTYNRCSRFAVVATIGVGEKIPEATLTFVDKEGELGKISVSELTEGKKITLVTIPERFTNRFLKHIPRCIEHFNKLRAEGVEVAVVAINGGWGIQQEEKVRLLNDGKGDFGKAMDFPPHFMYGDSAFQESPTSDFKRHYTLPYAIQVYVEDGVVQGFMFLEIPIVPENQ